MIEVYTMSEPHYALPFEIPPAKTDHIKRKMFDLAYADSSPTQKLDVYWPEEGDGPFPVIISIHGGAFMGGDKRDVQLTPMLECLKRDYVLVGVNYRMSSEAKFPALIHDVKAAIRWIRANAKNYLFDPQRIATWGGSAGGYLSLMMGVSAWATELENLSLGNSEQPSHVQAVVDWFGPTDFLKMDEQLTESGFAPPEEFSHNSANSPESLLLGEQITKIPELVHNANPETYIRSIAPPFFIQHGTHDNTVPHQQSVNMAAKLTDVIGAEKVTLELLPNALHADPAFETPQNVKKVLDFLDSILRP
jgi:acetyl esterase/lipase